MSPSLFDLESLLSPIGTGEFFSRYWEKSPLVIARNDPGRYAALLGVSDLDFILSAAFQTRKSAVEVLTSAGAPKFLDGKEPDHIAQIYAAYRQGATVRINRAQRYWKPLRALCRRIEQTLGSPVRANLYCTPAATEPSKRHYDNHDVLVLQLAGCKHWRVFDPLVRLPLANVPPLPFEERTEMLKYARGGPKKGRADIGADECGEPRLEPVLEAGDLLYMPRGFVHEAWTTDEASMHVTIGLHVLTWLDLLSVALARVSNGDERFRMALPVSLTDGAESAETRQQFETLLRLFAENADFGGALAEMSASFVKSRQATGDGALMGGATDTLDLDTTLERSPGLLLAAVAEGGMVGLLSAHGVFWMPEGFAATLRFVAQMCEFRVRDLPGQLSESSKLSLARRMVQDGFLRIAEAHDATKADH
ncbi:MAG: bifunctional lysine-specific demethylase and histidyl-hydroxylase [Acidobacteriota bacterium]|jgi:ribosomal protein L16 Arg81 hydroxylase|nr:bifunctional lysine-specific demethylase and histidyl-hydroxylase [Acidobacteriota bacterium]